MASPDRAERPLTDFEQVLLGVIDSEPRSGYGLKKLFNASPASAYQPSPGALYPALRRLEARGLLRAETMTNGRRALRLYHVTEAGRAVHVAWLRQPVVPATIGADLDLHLMRFALMENHLPRAAVLTFLTDLADALDGFVSGVEQYLASGVESSRPLAELALQHGIAVRRTSLNWARSALATLAEPGPGTLEPGPGTPEHAGQSTSKLFLRPSRT
jgi:DNA-binding PadR family transcriptional regulator